MSIAAARAELAAAAPAGVTGQDHYAIRSTPALVAGLPRSIRPKTGDLVVVELPLELIVDGGDKPTVERTLTDLAETVRTTYRRLTGAAWRGGVRWVETTDFGAVQHGGHDALSCAVVIEIHVQH